MWRNYIEKPEIVEVGIDESDYPLSRAEQWESNSEFYQNRIKETKKVSNRKEVNPYSDYYEYDYNQKDSVFLVLEGII